MPMGGRAEFRLCFGSFHFISESPREQEPVWNVLSSASGAVLSLMKGGAWRGGSKLLWFLLTPWTPPVSSPVMPWPLYNVPMEGQAAMGTCCE